MAIKNNTFLFRCNNCGKIMEIDLQENEDIEKATNDELILECACGGDCSVLLD